MRKPSRHIIFPFVAFSFLLLTISAEAQQLKLGNNPTVIDPSAVLQLESPNQGLLLSRVPDTTAINAFSPPDGMIIYFTDGATLVPYGPNAGVYERKDGGWKRLIYAGDGSIGIVSLNGSIVPAQTFATGTSGTGFNISTNVVTGVHTFNIPMASAMDTGLISIGTQTFGGAKTFANTLSLGQDLFTNGSSGIDGQVLRSSGTGISPRWENMLLDSLYNVKITSPQNGDILLYSNVSNNWSNTSGNGTFWKLTGNSGTNPGTNFIGTTDAQPLVFKTGGQQTGYLGYGGTSGDRNVVFGYQAKVLPGPTNIQSVAIGYSSNSVYNATAIGSSTSATGNYSTAIGYIAQSAGTNGVAIGITANASGGSSMALGSGSSATGNNTVAIGAPATAAGSSSIVIGTNATSTSTASYSIALGYSARTAAFRATAIGAGAYAWNPSTLILGDTSNNVKVGIGTNNPQYNLEVNGTGKFDTTLTLGRDLVASGLSGNLGQALISQGIGVSPQWQNITNGTVTSVGLSLPNIFNVTNSPVTSSGTLTGTLVSQNQNLVFASPNGSSGTPLFRALVPADVPVLNQNTTGQAGSVANALTFNNAGTGAASGVTYNGSAAQTISYNTIGAPSTTGAGASGTWNISISGNAATATSSTQWNGATNSITSPNIGDVLAWNGTNWINSSTIGNYWSLKGNSGTNPANNFLGTTDYQPLIFKVDGQQVGYLGPSGSNSNIIFGIGSSANFQSIAIGDNATAAQNNSLALGFNVTANAFQSIAIGLNTKANNNNSIAIGYTATAGGQRGIAIGNTASAAGQNAVAIGYNASAPNPNTIILGNSSINVGIGTSNPAYPLQVAGTIGATTFFNTSDIRYKKNLQKLRNVLSAIDSLHGYTYFFRTKKFRDKDFPTTKQIGMIAQEVEKYFPELVSTDKEGYKSLNYAQFTAVLLEAVKEQQAEINALKKENEQNKKIINDRLNTLQQKIDSLEKMIEKK